MGLERIGPIHQGVPAGLRRALVVALVVGGLWCPGPPAAAQAGAPAEAGSVPRPADEPVPSIGELVSRVQELDREAAEATRRIAALTELAALRARVDELDGERQRLAGRLDESLIHEFVRDDRVRGIVDRALLLQRRLGDATEESATRLRELGDLRQAWRGRLELWRRWQDELASDPAAAALSGEQVERALGTAGSVLDAADDALPELLALQQRLQRLDTANRDLLSRAEGVLRTWRETLFRRAAPVLLSAGHRARLREAAGGGLDLGFDLGQALGRGEGQGFEASPRTGGVLLAQIVLVLALGWGLSRLRSRVPEGSRWAATLRHPWAIGVLVAVAGLGVLYGPLPPLGRLAVGVALAGSAALIASGMFANPAKRMTVYLVSGAFVILAIVDTVALPVPVLRLVLAGMAIAGAPLLLVLGRSAAGSGREDQAWFRFALYLGVAVLVLVAGSEGLGYHFLAQWLLESAVVTAFVAFVATFLIRLARGGLHLALRSDEARRIELVSRVGGVLANRLLFLVKLVVVGAAGFYLLSVWDLAESPGKAWSSLVGAGVSVGEGELTVGRLLLGALAVYLAVAVSWALRLVLDQALFEHRRFERGVRDSIFTLLHYSLIVVGVFLALSLLGLDLSSFALVAGALGVGVGFGLQNVVNNFVSGLILLFERPVRIDDTVVVGDQLGVISKIGLRSTVLTTFDGAELIVPNADLISEKVVNWSLSTPRVRLVLPVGVAYGNEPSRIIELLEEVGRSYPESLDDPAPVAVFTRFGESSLDFELRVWLASFDRLLAARSALASLVTRRLAAEGVEIPFPQRDVRLRPAGGGRPATPGESDPDGPARRQGPDPRDGDDPPLG